MFLKKFLKKLRTFSLTKLGLRILKILRNILIPCKNFFSLAQFNVLNLKISLHKNNVLKIFKNFFTNFAFLAFISTVSSFSVKFELI